MSERGREAGRILPMLVVVWAGLIVAVPWVDALPDGRVAPVVGAATYWAGSMVCHQRPERSFHSNGARWPVCARCSGLYLSAALGTVVAWLPGRRRSRVAFHAWRVPLVAAALPTLVTLGLEWWRPAWSTPALRAITAVPLGFVVGALLAESMSFRGKLEGCVRMPSSE